jgi:hypothetical protein
MDMSIKIEHGGVTYTVETLEEAVKLGALLQESGTIETIEASIDESDFVWTPEAFRTFMEHLGEPQKVALSALCERGKATDGFLREAVGVSDNQALGGVLSGVSKQAIALGIPARAVFKCENYRNAGKRRSLYYMHDGFRQIAMADSSFLHIVDNQTTIS